MVIVMGVQYRLWFADDSAAAGKLKDVKAWWDKLNEEGPKFGYYP